MRRALVLSTCSAIAACVPKAADVSLWRADVPGVDRRANDVIAAQEVAKAGVASQAARELSCPPESVQVERIDTCAAAVSACGKKAIYVVLERSETTRTLRGYEGKSVYLTSYRFARADGEADVAAAVADLAAQASDGRDPPLVHVCEAYYPNTGWDLAVALNAQGARDLHCPRSEVFPSFTSARPHIPVAEGCGQRATYLPDWGDGLKLSSLVAAP